MCDNQNSSALVEDYSDEYFMKLALVEAQKAFDIGEVPVGAIVVQDNKKIISSAYNLRESEKQATAHAELIAISDACKNLHGWRLPRCTLYVTLEPCPMCAGAIINSRIDRVVYGASDKKSGSCNSVVNLFELPYNHKPAITQGVLQEECSQILTKFFRKLRQK